MKIVLIVLIALALIAVGFSIYARQAANNEAAQNTTQQTQNSTSTNSEKSRDDITEAQAVEIANIRMPGKTLQKVEIETENGNKIYSVRYTDGSQVNVQASNGEVVSTE